MTVFISLIIILGVSSLLNAPSSLVVLDVGTLSHLDFAEASSNITWVVGVIHDTFGIFTVTSSLNVFSMFIDYFFSPSDKSDDSSRVLGTTAGCSLSKVSRF